MKKAYLENTRGLRMYFNSMTQYIPSRSSHTRKPPCLEDPITILLCHSPLYLEQSSPQSNDLSSLSSYPAEVREPCLLQALAPTGINTSQHRINHGCADCWNWLFPSLIAWFLLRVFHSSSIYWRLLAFLKTMEAASEQNLQFATRSSIPSLQVPIQFHRSFHHMSQ